MPTQVQIFTPTRNNDEYVLEANQAFHHLMPRLRDGVVSAEVFSKERLAAIPIDPDVLEERRTRSASTESKAAKASVRTIRESVGEETSLQPSEKKEKSKAEETVKRTRARKRKGDGDGR